MIGAKAIKILITQKMMESKAAPRKWVAAPRGWMVSARRWVAASRG